MEYVGVDVIERSQPRSVKGKMRRRKLKSGVKWQEELKQKGVTQDLRVFAVYRP
jgi:hypothetical protein